MIEFQLTVYMCSHCTRVHNAAQDCLRHELDEHSISKEPSTSAASNSTAFLPPVTVSRSDNGILSGDHFDDRSMNAESSNQQFFFNHEQQPPTSTAPFTIVEKDDDMKPGELDGVNDGEEDGATPDSQRLVNRLEQLTSDQDHLTHADQTSSSKKLQRRRTIFTNQTNRAIGRTTKSPLQKPPSTSTVTKSAYSNRFRKSSNNDQRPCVECGKVRFTLVINLHNLL